MCMYKVDSSDAFNVGRDPSADTKFSVRRDISDVFRV